MRLIKLNLLQFISKKKIVFVILLLSAFAYGWTVMPSTPTKMTIVNQQQDEYFTTCPILQAIKPLTPAYSPSLETTFSLLNWNIYKQQNAQWAEHLAKWAMKADLITLQEAKYDQALIQFSQQQNLYHLQNVAFSYQDDVYGVNTFSRIQALQTCGTRYTEPWLRIPKTGVATTYAINGSNQQLLLINLHGVNFTLTALPLKEQVAPYLSLIKEHKGPIIISGDFNTWSRARSQEIIDSLLSVGFDETLFSKDKRLTVFGLPLDHVFYRGLKVLSAQSMKTLASDHTPQLVTFKVSQTNKVLTTKN